jgi:hypothetical protein
MMAGVKASCSPFSFNANTMLTSLPSRRVVAIRWRFSVYGSNWRCSIRHL